MRVGGGFPFGLQENSFADVPRHPPRARRLHFASQKKFSKNLEVWRFPGLLSTEIRVRPTAQKKFFQRFQRILVPGKTFSAKPSSPASPKLFATYFTEFCFM